MTPIFRGIVTKGKLVLDLPNKFLVYLASLEGKRFELSLQKERKGRTLSQNSYYWGVIIEILAQHFGYESDEMHEALKFKFLKRHEDTNLVSVGSTTKLSTVEMGEYIDKIIRWAAIEYQIYIPSAGEII